MVIEAIERTKEAFEKSVDSHWIIGFSGGKDSTALLKICTAAVQKATSWPKRIDVIYCDTGVENPVLDAYVKNLFHKLSLEFKDTDAPFKPILLKAPVKDRFFVKVIGRGYPTPTNSFRWCTKNLRINPVSRFIKSAAENDAIVSLGMRRGESQQRDRSLLQSGDNYWQTQREGKNKYKMFLPILDFSVEDVWDVIFMNGQPQSIDPLILEKLYRGASGECPIIKAPNAPPCGSGRFGCWTCTVVRKDKSAISLIENGYSELKPYLNFRNWIAEYRNDLSKRWKKRRNGTEAPGPFSLSARAEILAKLKSLEQEINKSIISEEELKQIKILWEEDIEKEKSHM